ncbi:unnamed protein product [Larinioides sclopetarius]|uniref:Uncharacterized protein n=1 Tax=Larinioides sclopetarius TaxID=280406 RepID=A0AAV2BGQ1_9ARAC
MFAIFITKRNHLSVRCVRDVLGNKPIWTGT